MDRNIQREEQIHDFHVALREESVDRNIRALAANPDTQESLSARRAWIEIISVRGRFGSQYASLSARRAWIEIRKKAKSSHSKLSLSARRAWIEISNVANTITSYLHVALREESVDRNIEDSYACRKGKGSLSARRAWIEIPSLAATWQNWHPSLSARRAWIEIREIRLQISPSLSLSARRAWIEIRT